MLAGSRKVLGWLAAAGVCVSIGAPPIAAARYADVPGYYEPGRNVDVVYGSDPVELYDNALAALGGPGEEVLLSQGTTATFVSLGGWSDDPLTGTNDRTPGLVVGFSVEVLNGPGDDLRVVGNAPTAFTFYEPGFVEVAIESDGGGAKPNGWQDETFYLIRPNHYDQIVDPRTSANDVTITTNPDYSLNYSAPFDNDADLSGWFDVTPEGDAIDLADAIDNQGDPVNLSGIAYVRLRSVSDSVLPFGSFLVSDVDYLEALALEGDGNGDGFVGLTDLDAVLSHWNQTVASGQMALGDYTGDGYVGLSDLDVVLAGWNAGIPPSGLPAPEPGTALILSCVLGLALRRRQ